jgi:hypothetical protein
VRGADLRITGNASSEEAAAVVAAVEQFVRDTAPEPAPVAAPELSRWKRAALAEGVARHPELPTQVPSRR